MRKMLFTPQYQKTYFGLSFPLQSWVVLSHTWFSQRLMGEPLDIEYFSLKLLQQNLTLSKFKIWLEYRKGTFNNTPSLLEDWKYSLEFPYGIKQSQAPFLTPTLNLPKKLGTVRVLSDTGTQPNSTNVKDKSLDTFIFLSLIVIFQICTP